MDNYVEDNDAFNEQEYYEEQAYYALGGTRDYREWKENGGNLDDMMDRMGF